MHQKSLPFHNEKQGGNSYNNNRSIAQLHQFKVKNLSNTIMISQDDPDAFRTRPRRSHLLAKASSSMIAMIAMTKKTTTLITLISMIVLVSLLILQQTSPLQAHSIILQTGQQATINQDHQQANGAGGASSSNIRHHAPRMVNNNQAMLDGSGPIMTNQIPNNNNPSAANNLNGIDNSIASQTGSHQMINNGAGRLNNGQQQQAVTLTGGYQNRCASGWMWFNNKCWVATQSRRDFSHAVELCKKLYNSSTLPTIHTDEENEFLRTHLELKNSPIWLFARHNHQYNKTRWLDRTPVNFTHWDAGQPSDKASLVCIRTEDNWYMKKTEVKDGQTECVSFWEDGKWGTQVGCQVLLPVVCEKKLTPMAKYQIQPNGSDPTFESINSGGSLGANKANPSLISNQWISSILIIASTLVSCFATTGSSRMFS